MTRPTENQLAEALEQANRLIGAMLTNEADSRDIIRRRIKIEKLLRAYRSAQQAEAGAAGGVREQFEAWHTEQWPLTPALRDGDGYTFLGDQQRWNAWAEAFGRGRQQGMEQARALKYRVESTMNLEQAPAEDFNAGCHVVPVASVRMAMEDPLAQPAASSVQESGWVMVPVDPTPEMVRAAESAYKADAFGVRSAWPSDIYRSMLRAAPARLAGAAQGEAQEPTAVIRTWHKRADQHAELLDWGPGIENLPDGEHALYANPQAQVERKPLSDEQVDDLLGEANRGFCIEREDYFKAFRDAERAHGIQPAGNGKAG